MSELDLFDNQFGGDDDDDYGLEDVEYDPINRDEDYDDYDADDDEEEEEEEQQQDFDKDKYKQSYTGLIVAVVLVVLVGGLAAGYFLYWVPKQDEAEKLEQARIEAEQKAQAKKDSLDQIVAENARLARIAAQQEADSLAALEQEPEPGMIETITEKTGRSFVVIGSFIDEDFAMDLANRMAAAGESPIILAPEGGRGYFRVALEGYEDYSLAATRAEEIKADSSSYGTDIWALKY